MKIFAKVRLRPSQLRTVAERRFADAEALRKTARNVHANGAIYLGGFVLECLLKAKLLQRFPWLQSVGSSEGLSNDDRYIWSLCYRSHDLGEILAHLPEVVQKISQLDQREQSRLTQSLKSVCGEWTIYARYSPFTADMADAKTFLNQIQELRKWLV